MWQDIINEQAATINNKKKISARINMINGCLVFKN